MKIQRNIGYVSTIIFDNFFDTKEESRLRDNIFSNVTLKCGFTPVQRLDNYDETILVFENSSQALNYLTCLFNQALTEDILSNSFCLRSGLCMGEYFSYQNQIYGEAVNFSTKLSYSSRQNEILVCGIKQDTMDSFTQNRCDVKYSTRNLSDECYSISLVDNDITSVTLENLIFKIKYQNKEKQLKLSRYNKISIGRSSEADVFIDDFHISRNHATITFIDDKISIEDHSSNGTYIYIDGHESYITNGSASLCGNGYILCGKRDNASVPPVDAENIISFQLSKERV